MAAADTIDVILERLASLHPKFMDLSHIRMWPLLERLGNPQNRLPPVIHVAGTNGKGSTIAFMRAMLEAQGLSVHVYTSPHLVHFRERMRFGRKGGGVYPDDAFLNDLLTEVEAVNGNDPITQFEITTIAAFLAFSRQPADVLLLEVGLGGRLDTTNVIERPAATVITSVSMDHADYLGDTVAKIAAEKAGIIKRGRPCVISQQVPDALAVIERIADEKRARLTIGGMDFHALEEHGRFVYQDEDGLFDLPLPALPGRHQLGNAATAIAGLKAAGFTVDEAIATAGMRQVVWPGRLQRLTHGELVKLAPPESDIWLDGGHNEDGGRVLSEAMAEMNERHDRELVMVCGMLSTKDPRAFLAHFAGLAHELIAVPVSSSQSALTPEQLVAASTSRGIHARAMGSVAEALKAIAHEHAGDAAPRILIAGSLYLVGDVLAANGTPPV